jgi:ketosteroid isomerase-like protein
VTGERSTEEVARGIFAALDRRDLDEVSDYLAVDDVQLFVPTGVRTGRQAVLAVFEELFSALPDSRMEVQEVLVQGDHACVRWRLRGSFTAGSFGGIIATGRLIDILGADAFMTVRGGLITANTIFYDGAAFARAVGLLPASGSASERLLIGAFNLRTRLRRLALRLSARSGTPHRAR